MISKINAIAFCESIIAKYKTENRNIDYLIGNEIIKFFFYFKSTDPFCNASVIDDLNSALRKYALHLMCDFYMKLDSVRDSDKYDMCWTFFLYNSIGSYHVERHIRT